MVRKEEFGSAKRQIRKELGSQLRKRYSGTERKGGQVKVLCLGHLGDELREAYLPSGIPQEAITSVTFETEVARIFSDSFPKAKIHVGELLDFLRSTPYRYELIYLDFYGNLARNVRECIKTVFENDLLEDEGIFATTLYGNRETAEIQSLYEDYFVPDETRNMLKQIGPQVLSARNDPTGTELWSLLQDHEDLVRPQAHVSEKRSDGISNFVMDVTMCGKATINTRYRDVLKANSDSPGFSMRKKGDLFVMVERTEEQHLGILVDLIATLADVYYVPFNAMAIKRRTFRGDYSSPQVWSYEIRSKAAQLISWSLLLAEWESYRIYPSYERFQYARDPRSPMYTDILPLTRKELLLFKKEWSEHLEEFHRLIEDAMDPARIEEWGRIYSSNGAWEILQRKYPNIFPAQTDEAWERSRRFFRDAWNIQSLYLRVSEDKLKPRRVITPRS